MIIKLKYNKLDGTLNLTKDEDNIVVLINNDTVIDNDKTLSLEIALDVSNYQNQFEEDIDGNNN
jgi:hypothetical protein|tara:strand:- start:2002 stop:2193 length:192 start_codon:yes stop_codon:yes gene_type:complete